MPRRKPLSHALILFLAITAVFFGACAKKGPPSIPQTLTVSPAIDTIDGIVTITGEGFNPDSGRVLFNDSVAATVLSATTTQVVIKVPYYTFNDRITVKSNGHVWQTAQPFTVAPKFSPVSEAPGYPVNVVAGGSTNIADYTVSFNGTPAKITRYFMGSLTAIVPDGATSGVVTVTYKGQPANSLVNFTVTPSGVVSTLAKGYNSPAGLAIDNSGNVYVTELQGGYIDKITPAGSSGIFAGTGTFSAGEGALMTAGVYGVENMAFAPNGDLYATNIWNYIIQRISGDSVKTFMYPSGPADATVLQPWSICIDATGNLYVSDNIKMQIKKITPAGVVSILAGQGLQGLQDGPAATATFRGPQSLILDAVAGNLYILDGNLRVLTAGGMVNTIVGGTEGYKDGIGPAASFNNPGGMVRDAAGNFYIADTWNNVIRRIAADGTVTTIAGTPGQSGNRDGSGANALFNFPTGMAIDKNGALYVSDMKNGSVRKIVLSH